MLRLSLLLSSFVVVLVACPEPTPPVDPPGRQDPLDIDGDGVPNAIDEDIDGDGEPNILDPDIDGDGSSNEDELTDDDPTTNPYGDESVDPVNCVGAQGDCDADGVPNNVDNDDDGDGTPDGVDGVGYCGDTQGTSENNDCDGFCLVDVEVGLTACSEDGGTPGAGQQDSDGDGIPDGADLDDDGDGQPDLDDPTPTTGTDDQDPVLPGEGEGEGPPGECFNVDNTTATDEINPRILVLLDKSGSMNDPDLSGVRKWDAAVGGLTQVVQNLNDSVDFGLALYPNGTANNNVCREATLSEAVQSANANDIIDVLNGTDPGGGTPTAVSLAVARDILEALPADGGTRAVVLATDGGPNCNDGLDGDTCVCVGQDCSGQNNLNCLDDSNAINAAAQLNAAGLPVFVIGAVGTENFASVLNSMAQAGGTARAGGTAYYDVGNGDELVASLEEIIQRVGGCRHDLPQNVTADQVTVTVNGQPVARDTSRQNGWDLTDPNTVELFGSPCAEAVNGGSGASIVTIQICPG